MTASIPREVARRDRPEQLLIVDRDVLLADAIASAARESGYHDVQVIAGPELVARYLHNHPPAVVLAGLQLATGRGCRLLGDIARDAPATRVVLIVDDEHGAGQVIDGLVAGARGVVYRNRGVESLLRALEVVRNGGFAVPRRLVGPLLERTRQQPVAASPEVRLTERQGAVLLLVCRGLEDKDIGDVLMISPGTVRAHLKSIFEKIGVGNRADAARWAGAHLVEVDA